MDETTLTKGFSAAAFELRTAPGDVGAGQKAMLGGADRAFSDTPEFREIRGSYLYRMNRITALSGSQ